jgi:hypothetical protein
LNTGAAIDEQDVVRPVADGEERSAMAGDRSKPFGKIMPPGRRRQALGRKNHMRRDAKYRIVFDGRLVGVEHDAHMTPPRRLADRPHELPQPVVREHDIGHFRQRSRVARRHRGDALIAIGHDRAPAASVDEDRRQRGREALDPLTGAGVDSLARQRRQHAVAVFVGAGRAAERPRKHRSATETGDGNRRIGRTAAIHREKLLGFDLAVVARKFFDAKDLVEHDDAGTQNYRYFAAFCG